MCGLVAIANPRGGVAANRIRQANTTIRHRGPDGDGVWVNASRSCGLGHVRLSIIDLEGGQQPLSSPDGSVHAVVNGEFYGHDDIRDEFARAGYKFASKSDSEILIPLYLKYGERCLDYLRGEFAFVLWDENRQLLLAARDRFGIKPLFYGQHEGGTYFGSEIKALLAMGVPARWDLDTVIENETGHRNCVDTLFSQIKSVRPGHYLTVRDSRITSKRYWDFDYPDRGALRFDRSRQDYIDEFSELLTNAVKLRLRADVPVGVYLSGGIDSSIVLGLMREQSDSPLEAFTLSFDHEAFDEGAIAREMAAFAGVKHSVIDIDANMLAASFEDTIWHNECPFGNSNTIAKYLLSRHVRDAGYKVVLTGEGSDEVLGGYSHYLSDMRLHNSRALGPSVAKPIRQFRKMVAELRSGNLRSIEDDGFSAVRAKLGFVPAQLGWSGSSARAFSGVRSATLSSTNGSYERFASLMASLEDPQVANKDPLNQSLYLSSKSTLPNMILTVLGDRVEMAHSIEARLPFLDHVLVEYLTRLPVELKIKVQLRGGIEKYILKEAARKHVTETLYQRTKHPFTAPPTVPASLDAMAEFINDTLHGSDMRNLELYDQAKVIDLHNRSKTQHRGYLSVVFQQLAGLAIMRRKFGLTVG